MKIHRWKLPKNRFPKMREAERTLFFLLGHAINEINVLRKLFYFSNNYDQREEWRRHAQITQGLVIARALIGKLNEAWEMLGTAYFGTHLSKTYGLDSNRETSIALKRLGSYFGKTNLVRSLRNSFGFHYDSAEIAKLDPHDLNEDELLIYMATQNGNTLYYASEYVINLAVLESIVPGDPKAAFEKLVDETVAIAGLFNDAAQGLMADIADIYLRDRDGGISFEDIDIGEPQNADEIQIPYFSAPPTDLLDDTPPNNAINSDA